ncbi:MAG: DUF11 domain-containing protein [Methanosarcinales archaeon]|nr:DUF11 domain-containing protein [Methanosarcinales archaeon]
MGNPGAIRVSGTDLDGVYVNRVTVPRYSEEGTWTLERLTLSDRVGNHRDLSRSDMISLGFPTEFRNSPLGGDLFISGMKFNDLNENGIKDDGEPGVPGWTMELLQGGDVIESVETDGNGHYSFPCLGPGDYRIQEVEQPGWTQTHPPGNVHAVTLTDQNSEGNDFGNHQFKKWDTVPPNLLSFDFDPKSVDTTASSGQITFAAHFADDLSGLGCQEPFTFCSVATAWFSSPSGQQQAAVQFNSDDRISGDDLDCIYSGDMILSRYSEPGTWRLEHLMISDRAGNRRELSLEDMAALNFPVEFVNGQAALPLAPRISLKKTASSNVVSPGGSLTYTITYANMGQSALQDVLITESYPSGVTFVSATPAPDRGTDNRWTLGTLPGYASGAITIEVRAPEESRIRFELQQSARGLGYVNTYRSLNTGREPRVLANQVRMTARGAGWGHGGQQSGGQRRCRHFA